MLMFIINRAAKSVYYMHIVVLKHSPESVGNHGYFGLTLRSCGDKVSFAYECIHNVMYTVVWKISVVKKFSYALLCTKIKCTKFFITVYKVCMLLR